MTSISSPRSVSCSVCLLLAACGDSGEPPEPPPEPRTCHLPRDDRRIVEIEAFPWDEWFALRADGTLVQFSSYGFQEWEEAAAGDAPCITSIDADGSLAGTSFGGSATMIDYILRAYRGLDFPHTFDLPESRRVVSVLGTSDLALLDDESTAWIYWQDRAPDDTTGHQRLEAVALPGPVVQIAGDAGTCFLLESGDVYCVDGPANESKYGLGDSPPPSGVFQIPVAGVEFLAVGVFHLCVITQARELLCAGRGGSGELGVPWEDLAPTFKRSSFEPVPGVPEFERVWLRFGSTCGATAEGELWCWGQRVELPLVPDEYVMPPTLVGTFPGLLDVALSDYSTCVLRADHRVVCRGALPDYLSCGQEDGWDVMAIDGCDPPGGGP